MQVELIAKTLVSNADGKFLILQRHENDPHRPCEWDLPGGQAEPGESPIDAAKREAREETGLQLMNLRPIHVTSRISSNCQVVKTIFTTSSYTGEVSLSHEHRALQWASANTLAELPISPDYRTAALMVQSSQLIPQ